MKPAPFAYHGPDTLDEALELLARYGDEARPLAGGQSLIAVLNFRLASPAVLVDLNRIAELAGVHETGDGLHIGAMTRQRVLERDPRVARAAPLLADALPHVAHPQIRNRGTIGGSLAHADPAAELPAVIVALGATIHLASQRRRRQVKAQEFFRGLFDTDRAPDELLVAVDVPRPASRSGFAFEEVARRHGDFALFGLAVALTLDERGACTDVRLVGVNTAGGAARLSGAEAVLAGRTLDEAAITEAADVAGDEVDVAADVHASVAYRRQLAQVLTRRALHRAIGSIAGHPHAR